MTIGFAGLPPEVTSSLIYSGPGASSLVAAASAWNSLAAELAQTAQGYATVAGQLASEEWLGPASAAMVAAVQPYVAWLANTAGQAEQAGSQAAAAASAFEVVFASVVPPPLVAANRAELAEALQTNLFGLNNNVIAQLEAQYAQFWAQNTSALQSYAGSSAAATNVTPFASAPAIANPAAASTQAAAQSTSAASIQTAIHQFFQQVQNTLKALQTPSGTVKLIQKLGKEYPALIQGWFLLTGNTALPTNVGAFVNGISPYAGFAYNTEGLPYFSVGMGNFGVQMAKSVGALGGAAGAAAQAVPKAPAIGSILGGGGQVAAGLGQAAHVSGLTVPSTFPGAQTVSTVSPAPAARFISEPMATAESGNTPGSVLGGMPVGGMGAGRGAGAGPRYGFKPTVMARPLPAG